jgi:hypothetical protein
MENKERTPFEETAARRLEKIRSELADIRGQIQDIGRDNVHTGLSKDAADYLAGGLTCVIVSISHQIKEAQKYMIRWDDQKFGPHLVFQSRGTGAEWLKECFVCGKASEDILDNIAAFVKSKEDGEKIVSEFFHGRAKLDFRPHEPNWIQVKVGTCMKHYSNLEFLHVRTRGQGGVIRACDVQDAINT